MNNLIERIWKQGGMVNIEDLRGTAFQAEESAHTFRIRGVDKSGEPLALSGTVGAVFLRADNTDVAITGTITDGAAEVTLTDECYDMPGRFGLTIYVTSDEQTVAVYAAIGSVCRTSSGVVSPETGEDVMDLINAIDEAIARIPQDYQDLEDDVAALQSDVADLQEDVAELQEETNDYAPVIVKDASGDIVSIDDGAGDMKLKTLVVNVDPVQDLHGQESPYPAGGGKNLFDETAYTPTAVEPVYNSSGEATSGTRSGFYVNLAPGTYTIHLEVLVTSYTYFNVQNSNNEFISFGNLVSSSAIQDPKTFTISEGDKLVIYRGSTGTLDVVGAKLQIEAGSTGTAWSPYENNCPISGWTSADVTRTGKNLIATDNIFESSNIESNGTITQSSGNSNYKIAIVPVSNGETYTMSGSSDISDGCVIAFYNSKPVVGSVSYNNNRTVQSNSRTFTSPIDGWVAVRYKTDDASPQIEIGSSASAYEAYQGTAYTYSFPSEAGTVYGGELTIHQDGTGTLVVVMNNNDNLKARTWTMETTTYGNVFSCNAVTGKAQNSNYICNKYKAVAKSRSTVLNGEIGTYNLSNAMNRFSICDNAYSTVEDFAASLNDLEVCYELLTPLSYDLTAQQVVSLLKGQNVLWADCGDVAIEYPADTKMYIDNLFASIVPAEGVSF